MAKSSVQKNLQKIHTYAQDIETVRSVKQSNTQTNSKQNIDIKESPKIVKNNFTPTPAIKTVFKKEEKEEEHNELMIPSKPKLPAIRTMEGDSKKIDKTKIATLVVAPKINKLTNVVVDNATTQKSTDTKKSDVKSEKEKTAEKKDPVPITKKSPETVDKPQEAKPPVSEKKITKFTTPTTDTLGKKQTRHTTYTATVITDTKHKRFSLWNELKKKLNTLFKTKTAKKKVNYTTPTTPLRKGVVQSATTNTARKTIADYSSLKDKVKARKPEENMAEEKTTDTNTESIDLPKDNSAEIEKTRFELLHSIEKEVGTVDNKLPDYLSPITKKQTNELPVFIRMATKNDKPVSTKESTSWEHYITNYEPEVTPQTKMQNRIPTAVPIVNVPRPEEKIIHVPEPIKVNREQAQQTKEVKGVGAPAFNVTPVTPRILPTIPPIQTEISNVDMSAVQQPVFTPIDEEKETYRPEEVYLDEVTNDGTNYQKETGVEPAIASEEAIYQTEDTNAVYEQPVENYQTNELYEQVVDTPITPPQYFTQPKIEPIIPGRSIPEQDAGTQVSNTQEQPIETQSPILEPVAAPVMSAGHPITLNETTPTISSNNPIPRPALKQNNRIMSFITQYTHIFVLGGLMVASVVIVGVFVATALLSQFSNEPTTTTSHNYFHSSAVYPVVVSPLSQLTITEQITRHNNAIGVSEVILKSEGAVDVSPDVLMPLLKLPLDPSFSASLLDIRFGWYREEPFVVMKYSGDSVARGALLQWERTMYTDLLPLFGLTPISPSILSVFKDATVENKDVRVLYTASGGEELMYGIVAPGHIIITTNEMSFLNLSNNFNPQ